VQKGQVLDKLFKKIEFLHSEIEFFGGKIEFLDFWANPVFAQTPKKKPALQQKYSHDSVNHVRDCKMLTTMLPCLWKFISSY